MNDSGSRPLPLPAQVLALRGQLRLQRQRIALQLDAESQRRNEYPRSLTMRFLTQRPGLALRLAAEVATLVLGARLVRTFAVAGSVARLLRSA